MSLRKKVGRWALIFWQILTVPVIALALILHFDASLAHRLSGVRFGTVTVAAVLSCAAVISSAWAYVSGPLGFLKKHVKEPYEPVGDEDERRLTGAARDLAKELHHYAEVEIFRRGLKNPEPLPVRWHEVNARADASGKLVGAGIDAVHVGAIGAIGGQMLDGGLRRIVLVGEPGSGKTAITLFLQRDLIVTVAKPADLVPLVLSLSTWNQESTVLDWATARLEERYPDLGKPFGTSGESVARRLIYDGRIWLVLDAMDERSRRLLGRVFTALNDLGWDYPVIVTCRTAEYLEASRSAGAAGLSSRLAKARIFELLAPQKAAIEEYLVGTTEPAPWEPVFDVLRRRTSPLAQALSTPLMVSLAHRIYQREPAKLAALLAANRFPDRITVENHLLDNLIKSAYGADAPRATRYLRFIAQHVTAREGDDYLVPSGKGVVPMQDNGQDIAWWRLI
jgi:hypothetical protein